MLEEWQVEGAELCAAGREKPAQDSGAGGSAGVRIAKPSFYGFLGLFSDFG